MKLALRCLGLWLLMVVSMHVSAADAPVMDAKASPEQVQKMIKEAAKSESGAWKDRPASGVVKADPKDGGYRLAATVHGTRTTGHSGPAKVTVIATIGDEQGGKLVLCAAEKSSPKVGGLTLECDIAGGFHVETKKQVVIQFGLGTALGIDVQEVSMQAYTGGAKSGAWLSFKLIPLFIGLLMLVYWFVFIRR